MIKHSGSVLPHHTQPANILKPLQHRTDVNRLGKVFYMYIYGYTHARVSSGPPVRAQHLGVCYPLKLCLIPSNGRYVGEAATRPASGLSRQAAVYISSSRWLHFKQTRRCCLKVKKPPCRERLKPVRRFCWSHPHTSCHSILHVCAATKTKSPFMVTGCIKKQCAVFLNQRYSFRIILWGIDM